MASSAPALLDPLAARDAMPVVASALVPAMVRGERVAPDVRGELGSEAVRIVRASGLIAAIEPVVSDAEREGTVIEQWPMPGVGVERETVLTLRLATVLEAGGPARHNASGGEPAGERAGARVEQDDTEEWFAGLAGVGSERAIDGGSGRRRRKHRAPTRPVGEMVFDTPPEPQAIPTWVPPTVIHARVADQPRAPRPGFGVWPAFRAEVGVWAARATRSPWRMGVGAACVLLCVVIGVRAFGSGRQGLAREARAPWPTGVRVKVMPASHLARWGFPRRRARMVLHSRLHQVNRASRAPRVAPRSAPVAVGAIPSSSASEAAVPRHIARPVSSQFAYLGR